MSKAVSVFFQILGYQCLIAMITTIRIPDILVFDLPFVGRAVLGFLGFLLVLAGRIFYRKHRATEKVDSTVSVGSKLVFLLVGLLPLSGARGEEGKEATAHRTQFFEEFSSKGFPDRYGVYLTTVTEKSARNGLVFSQSTSERRDVFKDFRISGIIDADQLDRMLSALEIEL